MWREIEVAKRRREDQRDLLVEQAWHTVRIYVETRNNKKMPPLIDQLSGAKKNAPHTPGQARAAFFQIAAQYGLTIRKRKKPRGK